MKRSYATFIKIPLSVYEPTNKSYTCILKVVSDQNLNNKYISVWMQKFIERVFVCIYIYIILSKQMGRWRFICPSQL